MSRLRLTIARRLKDAQNTAAMLTTFNEVDMTATMALRNQYKDLFEKKHGVKLGFMSFFVKAAIEALKAFPAVNAFIEGEEVTCAVLGQDAQAQALPVVRIRAPEAGYDYQNKYFTDDVQYQVPSGLPPAEEAEIQRITLQAYRSLGCRGWGRADIMIRARDRQPFLLEMNTSPGMTSHSLVPMSAQAAGIAYGELCVRLLAAATLDHVSSPAASSTGGPA